MTASNGHASFIWPIAEQLGGPHVQSEYGRVILPLTLLRRLDQVLEPTKDAVLEERAKYKGSGSLTAVTGRDTVIAIVGCMPTPSCRRLAFAGSALFPEEWQLAASSQDHRRHSHFRRRSLAVNGERGLRDLVVRSRSQLLLGAGARDGRRSAANVHDYHQKW